MDKIKVMISSTVTDLQAERDAVEHVFRKYNFVELVGAGNLNTSATASNSLTHTLALAKTCDLYILILGGRFGWELESGKSATEIEYDTAIKHDPTKVLIFLKEGIEVEDKQLRFINRVSDYFGGYWRTPFKYSHELNIKVESSFLNWLKERAGIGKELSYVDHFVRIAIQSKPVPDAVVQYRVTLNDVQFDYDFFGSTRNITFDRTRIYRDFWGCISELNQTFIRWRG